MTCTTLLTGRLGNLLFQYCFLRAYCERNGYDLCLPRWIGESIFDIPLAVRRDKADITLPEQTYQNQDSLIYTRRQVKEWLRIKPDLIEFLHPVTKHRKPVLLNVRQGRDYIGAGLVMISQQSYLDAAYRLNYNPWDCDFETDTAPTRLPQFQGDESASGLNATWVGIPSFYRLMTAQVLFRANSTFSWWAATLGNAKVYSPIIKSMKGGTPEQYCGEFVEGNWPVMADVAPNTDLHLKEE